MAERGTVGLRQVALLGAAIVGIVLGLAVGTSLLPPEVQGAVFRTPLVIVVLIVGTLLVLVRLVRRPPVA
jgi:hypothetical protein